MKIYTLLKKTGKGQLLIELVVAMGLMAIFLPALLVGIVATRDGRAQQNQRLQAISLVKEMEEAARSIRENGWSAFASNGTYHPEIVGSSWTLVSNSITENGFTKSILVEDVYRDSAGAITATGGTLDLSTKKITTTVSWGMPISSEVRSVTYLTRYLENAAYVETTQTQFNAGTKTGVTVKATTPQAVSDDGEIVLGAGGYSDWCAPSLLTSETDLPGQGYASAITAIEGKVFAGTGENSSGLSFMDIELSNTQPPTATLINTFDGYKTNGVFGESSYGYITSDTNSKEVAIINLTNTPYTEIGYFDAPGNSDGLGIYILGNVGYVTVGNRLYTFDLSAKNGSRPILDPDGVTLAGTGTAVKVLGNYAYVSISGASTELQLVNVSNPSNLQVVGQADVNGQGARDVFVNTTGDRTYLITGNSGTQSELFIINTATKTGNRPTVGSYNSNGMDPRGITLVPGNLAIMVGYNGVEYQVIDISNESSPQKCGEEDVNINIHDVASVLESDGDAYSYIVTSDADGEFRIIAGGPGGSYATSGVFESATFNPGYQTANNRFSVTYNQPSGTELRFQVSMAGLVGGICPGGGGYTFVGPDGTPLTYFTPASGVPVTFPFGTNGSYVNPGQCLRYKAYFSTTNNANSPVLNDVTINYSP